MKSNILSGTVGHPVTIQCPFPPQHMSNRKFLCKGDHRNNCTDMMKSPSRFTLQEDVSLNSFMVRITELKAGDAGTYWCGSDFRWSVGNYTRIQLSVGKIIKKTTDEESSSMYDSKTEHNCALHPDLISAA